MLTDLNAQYRSSVVESIVWWSQRRQKHNCCWSVVDPLSQTRIFVQKLCPHGHKGERTFDRDLLTRRRHIRLRSHKRDKQTPHWNSKHACSGLRIVKVYITQFVNYHFILRSRLAFSILLLRWISLFTYFRFCYVINKTITIDRRSEPKKFSCFSICKFALSIKCNQIRKEFTRKEEEGRKEGN